MTDIKKPEIVKNNFSEKVIKILSKVTIKKLLKALLVVMRNYFIGEYNLIK